MVLNWFLMLQCLDVLNWSFDGTKLHQNLHHVRLVSQFDVTGQLAETTIRKPKTDHLMDFS